MEVFCKLGVRWVGRYCTVGILVVGYKGDVIERHSILADEVGDGGWSRPDWEWNGLDLVPVPTYNSWAEKKKAVTH